MPADMMCLPCSRGWRECDCHEDASPAREEGDACPVCGCEERTGAGYLQCECPAPSTASTTERPMKLLVDQDWLDRRVENDPELPCEATPSPGEGDAPVAWRESFIAEEEEGPVVGILIDLPDGSQIWSGECSNALLEQAAEQEGSPADSGLFLMVAAKGKPTRPVAQVATVEDGIALARAVAACHAPAHPTPATPAGEDLREKVARHLLNRFTRADYPVPWERLSDYGKANWLAEADAILAALPPQAAESKS